MKHESTIYGSSCFGCCASFLTWVCLKIGATPKMARVLLLVSLDHPTKKQLVPPKWGRGFYFWFPLNKHPTQSQPNNFQASLKTQPKTISHKTAVQVAWPVSQVPAPRRGPAPGRGRRGRRPRLGDDFGPSGPSGPGRAFWGPGPSLEGSHTHFPSS